jgi:four helix bundle protein
LKHLRGKRVKATSYILKKVKMNRFDLEERLIEFSVLIINIVNEMPNSKAGNHLSGQLVRSGTSVSLNYGEAQSGESRRDFIHKMKIVLKELRETFICLKIMHRTKLYRGEDKIERAKKENNELISIFVKSTATAQKNLNK